MNALVANVRASTTASSSAAGEHAGMQVDPDHDVRVVLKENESALL